MAHLPGLRWLLLAVVIIGSAHGQAPPAKPARLDQQGVPLPAGAAARLGTIQLRHDAAVTSLAFAPDGRTLVSASADRTLRFWDPVTGSELHRLELAGNTTPSITFAPDGKRFAVGGLGAIIWDTAKRQEVFRVPTSRAHAIRFAPDGRTFASWEIGPRGKDDALVFRETSAGKELFRIAGQWRHAFAPDGKVVATGGTDGSVLLRDAQDGKVLHRLASLARPIESLAFSADGKLLVVAEWRSSVVLFDVTAGKELRRLEGSWPLFAPDGKVLALTQGSRVVLWDLAAPRELRRLQEASASLAAAFSPDGKLLATTESETGREVSLWDVAAGRKLLPQGHSGTVHAAAFSPAGNQLASGASDGTVRLWDVAASRELLRLDCPPEALVIAFSPDGKVLAAGGRGKVLLWELPAGKKRQEFEAPHTQVHALAFAPDGQQLATGSTSDQTIGLWDAATGKLVRKLTGPRAGAAQLAFAPDGKTLLAVPFRAGGCVVAVWDVENGKELLTKPVPGPPVYTRAAFHPDGSTVATTSGTLVHVWELPTGQQRFQLRGLTHPISQLAFSPQGLLLAVSDPTGIRICETLSGKPLLTFPQQKGGHVGFLVFAPDGRTLASTDPYRGMLIWDLGPPGWDGPRPPRGTPAELDGLWNDLAAEDPVPAYRASWTMAAMGARAVDFLKVRLRPSTETLEQRVARLVAALDGDTFAGREAASRELKLIVAEAAPLLRKVLEGTPPLEARRRIETILNDLKPTPIKPNELLGERLRAARSVFILEQLGTSEAREVLQGLAQGKPEARETQEAKLALARLARRPAR